MIKKREYSFDILRVISMILVIIIHVCNIYSRKFGEISNSSFLFALSLNTIARISVPIFLMISGALLLDRNFDFKKYIKRILKILMLIIVWDIIYLVWEYLYLGKTYDKLYRLLFDPYRAHLWFLYTIIVLYIFQPLLKLILSKGKVVKIIFFSIWGLFSVMSMFKNTVTNSAFSTIFSYCGFFVIGKYLYDHTKKKQEKKQNIILIISMVICFTISIMLNYHSSIKYNMFYNLYFAYRAPFIIIPSLAFYVLVISNYKKDTLNKVTMKLSDLSLGVYLIHGIFLDITSKTFSYNNIHSIIGVPIFTILIFIFSVLSVYLLKKVYILRKIV